MHKLYLFDNNFVSPQWLSLRVDNTYLKTVYDELQKQKHHVVSDFKIVQIINKGKNYFADGSFTEPLHLEIDVDDYQLIPFSCDPFAIEKLKEGNTLFTRFFGNVLFYYDDIEPKFVLFNKSSLEIVREKREDGSIYFRVYFNTDYYFMLEGGHAVYLMKYFETGKFDNSYYPYDNDKDLMLL